MAANVTRRPPEQQTDEATQEGLRLARQAGDIYQQTVRYFIEHVAVSGAQQRAGDYQIAVAVEHAEPLYQLAGGELHLAEPFAAANAHLEVVVADGGDGRFVPGLHVIVTLLDDQHQEVGTYHLPFLWHPTMYHYGSNVHVPRAGQYTARVSIPAPAFPRHDKVNGKRYTAPVTVEFKDIHIEPGRK